MDAGLVFIFVFQFNMFKVCVWFLCHSYMT